MLSASGIKNVNAVANVYKIYVMSDEDVMFKFSASAKRLPISVLLFARKEVRNTPFSSHAVVKGLSGKELTITHRASIFGLVYRSLLLNKH